MNPTSFYNNKQVFVTGGAGFIGSHLVDTLIQLGAIVTIGDNFSSGSKENIFRAWTNNKLRYKETANGKGKADGGHCFVTVDFQDLTETKHVLKNQDIVFHLAANIGGRGYIAEHSADCCEGFSINQNVVKAAHENGVERVLFASSACAYPVELQSSYNSQYLLQEEDAYNKGWANADETYGWAKLMGEEVLRSYCKQYGLQGSVTRYVTAYGPHENTSHAVIALIERALQKKDPYVVWGTGNQDRDFTYVDDIVSGTLLVCEKVTDGSSVNLGTSKRYTMKKVVEMIFDIVGWRPKKIVFDTTKPEGVKTRALSIEKARSLGWNPECTFDKGLKKTIEWFQHEMSS